MPPTGRVAGAPNTHAAQTSQLSSLYENREHYYNNKSRVGGPTFLNYGCIDGERSSRNARMAVRVEADGLLHLWGSPRQWTWGKPPGRAMLYVSGTIVAMPVDVNAELPIQLVSFLTHAGKRSARDEREMLLRGNALLESTRGRSAARSYESIARLEGTEAERRSALSAWSAAMERMWLRFTAPMKAEPPVQHAVPVHDTHGSLFDAWVQAHLPAACQAIALSQHPQRGRGLITRAGLRIGAAALSIPADLLLHAGAVDGSLLGAALISFQQASHLHDDRLLLLLLLALRRGAASTFGQRHQRLKERWAGYLALLGDGPFGHALEWSATERAAIAGTPLAAEVDTAHAQLATLHTTLVDTLHPAVGVHAADSCAPWARTLVDALGGALPTIEELGWGLCLIESRGLVCAVGASGAVATCLCPVADMINHCTHAQLRATYDAASSQLTFVALSDVDAGAEVFIDYSAGARKPATELLCSYGFLPDSHERCGWEAGTSHDAPPTGMTACFEGLAVELQLPADEPLHDVKQALIAARGLAGHHWLPLGGQLPPGFISAVRIGACLTPAELAAIAETPSLEAAPLLDLDHEQRAFRMTWKFVGALLKQLPPAPAPSPALAPLDDQGCLAADGESAAARSAVGVARLHPTAAYNGLVRRVLSEVRDRLRSDADELLARASAVGHGESGGAAG